MRAMQSSGMDDRVIDNIFGKFRKAATQWYAFIDNSFLPSDLMLKYKEEIATHLSIL
jgi:serine/threonine-protein kinase HipA